MYGVAAKINVGSKIIQEKDTKLKRMLSILLRVSESRNVLTSAQLAEELALPRPTVYRLVNNLYEVGLLQKDPFGKGHIPGDNLQLLARQVLSHEISSAPRRALLQQLSEEIGETCNITILDGKSPVYFDRVETDWPIRVQLPLGSRVPIHCTASGKLFLANMTKRFRMDILNNLDLKRHTEKTITDVDTLLSEIDHIKHTGIGTDNEEFIKGMVAVAVPVIDKYGSMIFSIAVHAPTVRSSIGELRQFVPSMRRTAAAIDKLYAGSQS